MTPPQHSEAAGESGGIDEGAKEAQGSENLTERTNQNTQPVVRRVLTPWDDPISTSIGVSSSTGFFNWLLPTGDVVCDEQTLRMHGLPSEAEPTFETFLSKVPPEDVEDLLRMLQPLLSTVGDYLFEYRVRWADGSLHTLESRSRVVPGPDGGPLRLMGVLVDITERRAAEEAARSEALAASRIQAVTAGLAAASSLADVRAAVERALPALGCDTLIIADVGTRIEVLMTCGRGDEHPLRVADDGPVRTAMSYQSALFYPNSADLCERFPQVEPIVKEFGLEGWAFLPLSGIPRMRGICLLGYANEVVFDEPERAMLVLAASAIGQAVHRAMLHDTEHSFALALQEGMLPRVMKFGPGVRGAWRYEAATTGIQVGGDWYDSVPLDDGATVLIIGDVEGHNVHAAGMMYRLRTAVRTYAAEKHQVDEVLRRAHEFVVEINEEAEYPVFATCLIARVDPETRTIIASRAGHIPPIVVPPDKPAHVPQNDVGAPLGVPSDGRYPTWMVPYEPGTRILLCTDGLLESIHNDLDEGIGRTLACLDSHRETDLEELANLLLDANRPGAFWNDDVALLLAQLY